MVKKNMPVEKILRITNENINSVSLEIQKDKSLFDLNIHNVILYILYNFEDKSEMLAKLKVLNLKNKGMETESNNVEDEIMEIIFTLTKSKGESFFKKNIFMVLKKSKFSTKVSTWYFKNRDLSPELANMYLLEFENFIFDICKITFDDNEDSTFESEVNDRIEKNIYVKGKSNVYIIKEEDETCNKEIDLGDNIKRKKNSKEENEDEILTSLEDSDEIHRMNKTLGKLFQDKTTWITKEDKQKIAKILDIMDIMDIIINKDEPLDVLHLEKILRLVDIDDVLFKKVNKVLKSLVVNFGVDKHEAVFKLYVNALYKYKNIYRTINSFYGLLENTFDFYEIFAAANENSESNLAFIDRSILPLNLLYRYCIENNIELGVFESLLIHLAKNEDDLKKLEKLKGKIEEKSQDDESKEKIMVALVSRITYLNLQKTRLDSLKK